MWIRLSCYYNRVKNTCPLYSHVSPILQCIGPCNLLESVWSMFVYNISVSNLYILCQRNLHCVFWTLFYIHVLIFFSACTALARSIDKVRRRHRKIRRWLTFLHFAYTASATSTRVPHSTIGLLLLFLTHYNLKLEICKHKITVYLMLSSVSSVR